MYATRYAQPTRFNPGGLAAAIAINAGFVAALIWSAPTLISIARDKPLETYQVDRDTPPPEEKVTPVERRVATPTERLATPDREVKAAPASDLGETTDLLLPPAGPPIGGEVGPIAIDPPASPVPLPYVEASVDPRYADALQPEYPASERRAGREGRVTLKVLVGIDGRVKQAERLTATSDAFWRATLDQAMRRWRFRAATRGGIPVEAWHTMALRFELRD